jgi:hypothetical protein
MSGGHSTNIIINRKLSARLHKHAVMARIKFSYRRKQLLNWYRTANPEKWLDFHYCRWKDSIGAETMKEAIYKATEDQLDDLYILREELRLGI